MSKKTVSQTILPWLRDNLGDRCTAPLTGTDVRALLAAVQIIDLYSVHNDSGVLEAFGLVVNCMQPSTQELAYHSIAHVMNWWDRERIWKELGLAEFKPRVCAWEPGGSQRKPA